MPCGTRLALTRATETVLVPHLAERREHNQDAFRRVATDRVAPTAAAVDAIWFESAARPRAPFSPRSRRRVRQHSVRRTPRPASLRRLALRLLVQGDARCVGPTSAISRSSYEHPRLVGSRCVKRLRTCAIEEIACFTFRTIRFGGSHVLLSESSRWALSSRRDACEPDLWHPCRLPHGGHAARAGMSLREGRRDHPPRTRVNEVRCRNDPRCLPSSKDRCPATPFRASGFGLRPHRDLAAALLTIDAFSLPLALSSRREPGPRPRAPLPAGGALL